MTLKKKRRKREVPSTLDHKMLSTEKGPTPLRETIPFFIFYKSAIWLHGKNPRFSLGLCFVRDFTKYSCSEEVDKWDKHCLSERSIFEVLERGHMVK